jgi:hypothetical protein
MAALFISSSDRCLCGRHEGVEEGVPCAPHRKRMRRLPQKAGENVA